MFGLLDIKVKIYKVEGDGIESISQSFLLLADSESTLLHSADGFYLAVKEM